MVDLEGIEPSASWGHGRFPRVLTIRPVCLRAVKESNPQPMTLEDIALPIELTTRVKLADS